MGQKWRPLKLGGYHGLRRLHREGVFAGPLPLIRRFGAQKSLFFMR